MKPFAKCLFGTASGEAVGVLKTMPKGLLGDEVLCGNALKCVLLSLSKYSNKEQA